MKVHRSGAERKRSTVGKAVVDFLRHLRERNASINTIKAYSSDLASFAAYAGSRGWKDLDHIAISYAAQVVRESMKSPEARHMGVPTIPLTDLYNAAGDYIRARGGELRMRSSIETFRAQPARLTV